MHCYTITIDGRAYGGESDAVEDQGGALAQTFRQEQAGLRLGGAPLVIVGRRNLSSHVDRIVRRMADGRLDADEIVIRRTRED